MTNRIYGWYSSVDQPVDQPTHNPPFDAPCLLCGETIFDADVRTISLMYADRRDGRAYFYRAHKTCHERASEEERQRLDGLVLDMIGRAAT